MVDVIPVTSGGVSVSPSVSPYLTKAEGLSTYVPQLGNGYLIGSLVDDAPTVTLTSPWGIDSDGNPYFDATGAASGEAAYPSVASNGAVVLTQLAQNPVATIAGEGEAITTGGVVQVTGPSLPRLPTGTPYKWDYVDETGTWIDTYAGLAP